MKESQEAVLTIGSHASDWWVTKPEGASFCSDVEPRFLNIRKPEVSEWWGSEGRDNCKEMFVVFSFILGVHRITVYGSEPLRLWVRMKQTVGSSILLPISCNLPPYTWSQSLLFIIFIIFATHFCWLIFFILKYILGLEFPFYSRFKTSYL